MFVLKTPGVFSESEKYYLYLLPTSTESNRGGGGACRRQENEKDFYVNVIQIFNRYSAKMLNNIDTRTRWVY